MMSSDKQRRAPQNGADDIEQPGAIDSPPQHKGIRCVQFSDSYLPLYDGVSLAVDAYARWLNALGDTCYIAGPRYPGYTDHPDLPVYRFRSMPVPGHAPYRVGMPALDPRFNKSIYACPLDIVHAHSPFTAGASALRLARARGVPIVATFHSKYYDDFLETVHSKHIARGMLSRVIRFYNLVDDVWTVNDATAHTLREYGYKGHVRVMPNGSDYEAPGDIPGMRARAEAMLGIDAHTPLLIFVGRLEHKKNPQLLLEALTHVTYGAPYHVALAGNGMAADKLKALAAHLGLSGRVTFLGEIRDREALSALYCRAGLLVFPSLYDNAPLVVKEAAANGCPALLIKDSNAADGVRDGYNGYLCAPDALSIARVIDKALADPALAAHIGERARSTLALKWRDVVVKAREAYAGVINEHARQS